MKLARKLMFALVVAMLAVFSARALLRVRSEIERSQGTMRDDERLIGRVLRPPLVQVWRAQGRAAALDMLRSANANFRQTEIRWVTVGGGNSDAPFPRVSGQALGELASTEEVTVLHPDKDGQRLTTYLALSSDGSIPGALEISKSVVATRRALRDKVIDIVKTAALATLVSMGVVSALGFLLVGRPMRRLAEQARRIGAGDLTHPLHLRQNDEIGELAREMNQMSDRLRDAQTRLASETVARLKTLDQLRHADRLSTVGKLASGIAHELGTPLNVVCGRAKMIATGELEGADGRESARTILEQGQRMTKIIRDLLGFARRSGPQKALCQLESLAQQCVSLLQPLAQKSRVQLVVRVHGPPVPIDAGQLQQALTNLVVNAIQAMPNGGTVTISTAESLVHPPVDHGGPSGTYAYLAVRDEGVGIPAQEIPRLFEPFYTTKGVGEGTGLGLSVAYGITRDHGGWIDVESEVGKGSCFTIYLPLPS